MALAGKVCLVTGATRGIGRGIALQLGESGATVYITGRTLERKSGETTLLTLKDTADEIESRGGQCIPVQVDHSDDTQVQRLFERISKEQDGRLDLLVNNAFSAVTPLCENFQVPFWECSETLWDEVNIVGLRNHYMCAIHAARLMVPRKQGLIINISSAGGLAYFLPPPYGIGKEACDRMACDCSQDLKEHKVAFVSLWPGAVKTEAMLSLFSDNPPPKSRIQLDDRMKQYTKMFPKASESVDFVGRVVTKLAQDPNVLQKTGHVLLTGQLASEYGITDIDGSRPGTLLEIRHLLYSAGYTRLASCIPRCLKLPKFLLWLWGNRF